MAKRAKASSGATKAPAKSREQRQAEKQTLAMWALLGNGGAGIGSALKPEVKKAEPAKGDAMKADTAKVKTTEKAKTDEKKVEKK